MIQPTETLRREHQDLRGFLAVLRKIAGHVGGGGTFPVADCADALRFLREFVLGVHFRKEGDVVFPAIAMHGSERDAEGVGQVLRLQDEAQTLIHSLVLFWEPTGELTPAERSGFADTVATLGSLLDRITVLEERALFPCAESVVPADDRLDWIGAFAALEHGRRAVGEWQATLTRLAANWD